MNAYKKAVNNRNDSQFKVRLRNENDIKSRNNVNKSDVELNRTPSSPKVLMSTNKFYKELTARPVTQSSYLWTKCYDKSRRHETPDCERKLKKLEESGLLAKFTNFQITKSIPLALEDEDENERSEDEVFVSDMTEGNSSVIELKTSDDFEPQFVKNIKSEVRKISSQSFGSQASQRSSSGFVSNDNIKRKSSNSSKSQNNVSIPVSKWQQKLPIITKTSDNNQFVLRKSKSNNCLVDERLKNQNESQSRKNDSLIRHKSDENFDKENKKKRSHSSNGRLSSSASDIPNDKEKRKSEKSDLQRSKSQSSVERESCNPKVNKNNLTNSDSNGCVDKQIRKIKVNNKYYQILNCIGTGGSSKVYQVYDPELQMTLAIKVVDLSKADEQTVSGFKNEITLLNQLRQCKRVVRMYDYEYQNNGQLLLVVMEKGDSDLSNVLKSFIDSEEKRSLDPHLIRFYWQEMVKVVDEIHQYGIVHSDLKPVNFILVAGKLKLIDFGIANAIKANYTSVYKESQIGTINFMAPEALQNRSEIKGKTIIKFNCKADIWSLGCILYNLVYGRTPFHHYNNLFQKANAILDPKCEITYPPIDDLLLLDCMQLCLQKDPNKRPTTGDLLNHRYISQSSKENGSQTTLINKINNLTPNRIKQLSQVIEKLSKH